MSQLLKGFYKLLMVLSGISMVATFVIIMLNVLSREFLWDIPGLDAYAGYAIASTLFFALPSALRHGDHIRVTMVLQKASPRVQNILEYWSLASAAALSSYFAWYAGRLAWNSYIFHDVSPAADVTPMWIPQIAMVLGCIGFAVAFIDALISRVQGRTFFEESDGESARAE
jgi:TRAP-type C4-dicarboxylate transport system permease small subunit